MVAEYEIIQGLINGVLLGGVYGLLAVGLSLCFGVTRVANSAHAAFAVVGAFLSYWVFNLWGLDPIISIAVPVVTLAIAGIVTYRVLLKRVMGLPPMTNFTLTFFLGFLLENLMILMWGNQYRSIITSYGTSSVTLGSISIPLTRLLAFSMAIACFVILAIFIRFTYTGKAMRALSQNREASYLMGINVDKLYMLTFAIALATGGAAGTFLSLIYTFYPSVQALWIGKLYVIITIGGLGNMMGSLITAVLLGILEATVGVFMPAMWSQVAMWGLLLLSLMVKPEGLFGRRR